jgi:hypothetical protein
MNTMSLRYPASWPALRQCAAVISRSRPGLVTTLAVQKWFPLLSRRNSAPIRGASSAVRAFGEALAAGPAAVAPARQARAASRRAGVQ